MIVMGFSTPDTSTVLDEVIDQVLKHLLAAAFDLGLAERENVGFKFFEAHRA